MGKWDMKWIWGTVALLVLVIAAFRVWPVEVAFSGECDRVAIPMEIVQENALSTEDSTPMNAELIITEPEAVKALMGEVEEMEFRPAFRAFNEMPYGYAGEVRLGLGDESLLELMLVSEGTDYGVYVKHDWQFWTEARDPERFLEVAIALAEASVRELP